MGGKQPKYGIPFARLFHAIFQDNQRNSLTKSHLRHWRRQGFVYFWRALPARKLAGLFNGQCRTRQQYSCPLVER